MTPDTRTIPAPSSWPRRFLVTWARVLKDAAGNWVEDRAMTLGSSLAYYALFSLAPLVLIAIFMVGLILGAEQARSGVLGEVERTVGEDTAWAIEKIVVSSNRSGLGAATVVGLLSLLFGASGVFVGLQNALDQIWKTSARPSGGGLWSWVKTRLLSVLAVVGTGVLLLVSLLISSTLSVLGELARDTIPGGTLLWQALNELVSLGLITLLFALIYRLLPEAEVAWGDVWGGAVAAAMLFLIGKQLFGLYLSKMGVWSMYASAASVVVILLWVYYSSLILLFGAEVSHSYATLVGSQAGTSTRTGSH